MDRVEPHQTHGDANYEMFTLPYTSWKLGPTHPPNAGANVPIPIPIAPIPVNPANQYPKYTHDFRHPSGQIRHQINPSFPPITEHFRDVVDELQQGGDVSRKGPSSFMHDVGRDPGLPVYTMSVESGVIGATKLVRDTGNMMGLKSSFGGMDAPSIGMTFTTMPAPVVTIPASGIVSQSNPLLQKAQSISLSAFNQMPESLSATVGANLPHNAPPQPILVDKSAVKTKESVPNKKKPTVRHSPAKQDKPTNKVTIKPPSATTKVTSVSTTTAITNKPKKPPMATLLVPIAPSNPPPVPMATLFVPLAPDGTMQNTPTIPNIVSPPMTYTELLTSEEPDAGSSTGFRKLYTGGFSVTACTCPDRNNCKCNMRYMSKNDDMNKHHRCEFCGKKFKKLANLRIHHLVHTGERPFSCSMCGKMFSRLTSMKNHIATHTGNRRYKCGSCAQTFITSSHLKIHIRTHTGERPYVCVHCDQRFISASRLSVHQKKHQETRPYRCSECDYSCKWADGLKSHAKVHTGERPYSCGLCGRCFAQSCNYKQHVKTHNVDKPHKCDICGHGFKSTSGLRKHRKTHK